jgi:2-polyprenyl-6-methoxyphenol hydroxylase-like FAD-dependent oxidoreductase
MLPWGVSAAKRLGILDDLIAAGGHRLQWWSTYRMGQPGPPRDLYTTTPHGDPALDISHPDMQEALLQRAIDAGVEVRRGATVTGVESGPGRSPSVSFEQEGKRETLEARVVVGADGRASQVRRWAGFEVKRSPELLTIAGVLLQGSEAPDQSIHLCFGPGMATFLAPLGGGRARAYFVYPGVAGRRGLTGGERVGEFLESCRSAGASPSWLVRAEAIGPLAEFESFDRWVDSPVKNGVALIGDAAAASDPAWGCGLSLTLLDVESLSRALRGTSDWAAALDRYASEHDEYYGALHRILDWMTELVWTAGPDADARRAKVFPAMTMDPSGYPDSIGQGPFGPSDERARRLILGLD